MFGFSPWSLPVVNSAPLPSRTVAATLTCRTASLVMFLITTGMLFAVHSLRALVAFGVFALAAVTALVTRELSQGTGTRRRGPGNKKHAASESAVGVW